MRERRTAAGGATIIDYFSARRVPGILLRNAVPVAESVVADDRTKAGDPGGVSARKTGGFGMCRCR